MTPSTPLTGRALEIFNEVHANGGTWDAYDQGRFARASGVSRDSNPWVHPGLPYHTNIRFWWHGWDVEDRRVRYSEVA